jgi:hypothetical protein
MTGASLERTVLAEVRRILARTKSAMDDRAPIVDGPARALLLRASSDLCEMGSAIDRLLADEDEGGGAL